MDSKEFIVSTDYQGYVFVGCAQGTFENDKGQRYPYYSMFVLAPVSTATFNDYQAMGMKAEKKKCISADVWSGLSLGDRVRLFFDDKGRIISAAIDN
jgi:hypothetical protein